MVTGIRLLKLTGMLAAMALCLQPVTAQKPPTSSQPGGGNSNNPGPAGSVPPSLSGTTTGPPNGTLSGSIYITGKVMLDDGTPPPESVTIERVCTGTPKAQAYTDRKGRFSFQLGQTSTVTQDASEDESSAAGAQRSSGGTFTGRAGGTNAQLLASSRLTPLDNCDLRAVLAGFTSDNVSLGGRRLLDDPDVGTIYLHRMGKVEGSSISVTSLQAPKEARKAYENGLRDLRREKEAEAAKQFHKAVDIYPKYAVAWYELGRIQQNQDVAKARQSFANALAPDPTYVKPYLQLTELAAKAENWAELADITRRLIKLDPVDYPMAYFYQAAAQLNLGHIDTAETSARAGAQLDRGHAYPKLDEVLAMILARKKDYTGAVAHLRNYLALAPYADDVAPMKIRLAELVRLSGANQQANAAPAGKDDAAASGPDRP